MRSIESNNTLPSVLGSHRVSDETELEFGNNRLEIKRQGPDSNVFVYRRHSFGENAAERKIIASGGNFRSNREGELVSIGVYPSPGLLTPKKVASHMYLKFKSPIVLDPASSVEFYTTFPIEIAVYRQSGDEELLLDAFSMRNQKYALYGTPEKGTLCRFATADVWSSRKGINPVRYEEAVAHVFVRNEIDNIIEISKLVIPMDGVILDHIEGSDESFLPGHVEMHLDQTFGKDVIIVRLIETKVKRSDKTSLHQKEQSLTFRMDAGY